MRTPGPISGTGCWSWRKLPGDRDGQQVNIWPFNGGPIPRQLLTRTDDFFDDLLSLTLFEEKLVRVRCPIELWDRR